MSTEIRECVKGIVRGRNLDELLPEYVSRSMEIHDSHARLELMMEYYLFYEMVSEGINPYLDTADETVGKLHRIIHTLFHSSQGQQGEYEKQEQELLVLRREVIEKMQVLTAYVDCFVVYEYILNRVQYRFEKQEETDEDSAFVQDVLNFIFSTKDNMAVNDNIRTVLGQLPMRMARSRYFDIVRGSIMAYKDSDRSSLEGHLYMFQTNAMLYHTDAMEKYFTEFVPVLKELSELDYEKMNQETYQIYEEKIRVNASRLNDISDLYMLLGKLINSVYSLVLAAPYQEETGRIPAADTVICGINDLFLQQESDIWKHDGDVLKTEEEKLLWLGNYLPEIEGKQERIYEAMEVVDAVLEETEKTHASMLQSLDLEDAFDRLGKLMKLSSGSTFVELEQGGEEEMLTQSEVEQAADELIARLKEMFRGQSRMVRRAIMANTLEKLPVFFNTPQEVADYISQSVSLCDDSAEKYASKQLIRELMD